MSEHNLQTMRSVIEHREKIAEIFGLLANSNRLSILSLLLDKEMKVGDIADAIGLSQSAVSQHLAKLRAQGIVTCRRDAQRIYYALSSKSVRRFLSVFFIIDNNQSAGALQPRNSVAFLPV